ncbi:MULTISPECIES: hypothetical protein [unclassified Endozoicomonas]|uniref:hypothetical protein n=1 Tax=unclassified Endozoicomonas TaxID=2644528 RepID=UPI0021483E26|nr:MULTISPECIES: hypothetical protein [unclassified Endozoicomonas]
MIKLHHHLAQLIAPLYLLQVLSPEAQNTTQNTTQYTRPAQTTLPPTTVLCDNLTSQTSGVQRRLNQYSELVRGRQCIVLSADPKGDLAQLINRLGDNTVILLSSGTTTTMKPSFSVTPVVGKTPVNYLIGSEIILKDGQDIIGAADNGFEVVIMPDGSYTDQFMVRVGDTSNFRFGETKDNNIRHITFRPTGPKGLRPIHSTVFGKCYNRRLIIENNVFHLPKDSGVRLDCSQSLDASANDMRTGPGLLFAHNTVKGKSYSQGGRELIPTEAVTIHHPDIKHQSQKLAIIDNIFQDKISEVGKFTLGPGSSINIFRNRIDVDNRGTNAHEVQMGHRMQKNGFAFKGITDSNAEPPLFNLAGNQIRVRNTAINIDGQMKLALACNYLQAVKPWRQEKHRYSLKAVDPLSLADQCKKSLSSSVGTTSHPSALCQIVNSWTAIDASPATALKGLTNLEGQLYFDPAICQAAPSHSVVITGTTATTTALGIMTTLNLLLIQ